MLAVTVGLLALVGVARAAPAATQEVILHPGWNAVFLEVQPEPRDPATVFTGLPVESVWAWMERRTAMSYLRNPGEPLWDKSGWNAWLPSESYLSNLFTVIAGQAYLVKIGGADTLTWTVSGQPSVKPLIWTADSFNLVGFPVDPEAPPTFGAWFAPSPAHDGQAIYRLSAAGIWEFVDPAATAIRKGEAYWVWCEGVSSYQGPLTVSLPGDGLDYGQGLTELTVTVVNASAAERTVTLRQADPASPEPLAPKLFDPATKAFTWPPLPLVFDLRAGGKKSVALAVRREALAGTTFAGILQISDDAGTLHLVPVSAAKAQE